MTISAFLAWEVGTQRFFFGILGQHRAKQLLACIEDLWGTVVGDP